MLDGYCHCGAVSWSLSKRPEHLTQCTCSLCRRLRALWIHAEARHVALSYEPDAVHRYVHGDRTLAMVSCKTCGCTTHWEPEPKRSPLAQDVRMAVNAAMADPDKIAPFKIRTFDGAESWTFLD